MGAKNHQEIGCITSTIKSNISTLNVTQILELCFSNKHRSTFDINDTCLPCHCHHDASAFSIRCYSCQ